MAARGEDKGEGLTLLWQLEEKDNVEEGIREVILKRDTMCTLLYGIGLHQSYV